MKTAICRILILFARFLITIDGAKILAVEPVALKSHWNFFHPLLKTLSTRHQVTVLTPFPTGNNVNYTEFDTSQCLPMHVAQDLNTSMDVFGSPEKAVSITYKTNRNFCNALYKMKSIHHILDGTEQFDVIISEYRQAESLCYTKLRSSLSPIQIFVIASPTFAWKEPKLFGTRSNPSFEPNLFLKQSTPNYFIERLTNTALLLKSSLATWYIDVVRVFEDVPEKLSDSGNIIEAPSLLFSNTHYVTEPPRKFPTNLIQIGGIHLTTSKPLPQDILEFIENSPHGVIYFTFGSVVSMSTLPDHIQKAFKEALAQVPQRVLWKYEGEMKDKPANVMTSKWFPQRDILLHPNVKLFISHGGISGVYEAVDAGVPVLGFPLFYDQPRNIENLVEAGMAISLDLLKVTKKPFLDAVTELINNKSYAENAKITSERFKDRPMTPAESVVYWTEYVIRHKGAPHLRSHALDLTWYQYFLLDVIAALLLALSIAGYVAYKVLKLIYSLASGQLLKNTKHKAE
ncbi:UDP-glucosyltransferase 2-like isoform X8 [Adelges cooleyi]|uniref:UDP-glucosyltransferase 2-like isoform X8 n=1 Tax=Adelges cooleyi TaxID=133065 RepID=UPI0021805FE1|nr:UDP-glucosyltransferase 2-like isoform X8 [Adelges cooleyi]